VSDAVLSYEGVTHVYSGRVAAVQDFDLDVPAASVVGLVGPNGAGKSTLMRLALGLVRPMRGTVRVFRQAPGPEGRRRMAYIPEDAGLPARSDVLSFLDISMRFYGMDAAARSRRLEEVLEQLDLADLVRRRIGTLSVGQRQRVAVAQALLHEPDLLLLDEPGRGLDPRSRSALFSLLSQIARAGKTLVITSHMLEILANICTHVCVIQRGRLMLWSSMDGLATMEGPPTLRIALRRAPEDVIDRVRSAPGVADVQGEPGDLVVTPADLDVALEHVPRRLIEAGAVLLKLEVQRPTLQDLYMKILAPGDRGAGAARRAEPPPPREREGAEA
jgi:ABC-2 type transport system ATP-binding protein